MYNFLKTRQSFEYICRPAEQNFAKYKNDLTHFNIHLTCPKLFLCQPIVAKYFKDILSRKVPSENNKDQKLTLSVVL